MDAEDILTLAAVGAVAYVVWSQSSKWNTTTGRQALENAGLSTFKSTLPNDNATFARQGNTLYRFSEGSFEKLNLAQRLLITADKAVPGNWLTRMVLT